MLLTLASVTHRVTRGRRHDLVLNDVSLQLGAGDCIAVRGQRRSGRTALLRVCAGMEPSATGTITFDGRPLTRTLLGKPDGIGFCHRDWGAAYGDVAGQVAMPAMRTARSVRAAHYRAADALDRVGVGDIADLQPGELEPWEEFRVALARAVVTRPRLLLLDAPMLGLSAPRRDETLELIRSFADVERLGVLLTVDDIAGLTGRAHRTLSLHDGQLRGDVAPEPARVVTLRRGRTDTSR